MNKLTFTHYADPMPCPRPRVTSKGTAYMPIDYQVHKEDFITALREEYGYWQWGDSEQKKPRYKLTANFYRTRDDGDLDNLQKTLMDVLQRAGIISNDNQIIELVGSRHIDKTQPRTEFELEQLPPVITERKRKNV